MRRILEFIDWRFIFSLALLVIVLMVGHSYWNAQQESAANAERVDRLILVHDREQAAASAERRGLLASQRAIEADSEQLADRYAALVAWLQSRGYRVPVGLIAPELDIDGDGNDDSDSVDRDADRREQSTRPKARPPSGGSSNGGSSNGGGNGGGGSGDGGFQSGSPGRSDSGGSKGRGAQGSDHSDSKGRSSEHRRP